MIDPLADLSAAEEAMGRLLASAGDLDNASTAAASRLPGWSRGHVLAHIARNADALVNVLEGRPMYVDASRRDADIERDATRPLGAHLDDVRASGERFVAAARRTTDWDQVFTLRNGATVGAALLPFRRLGEIELHHVDLDAGYGLADLPREFTAREIALLAERLDGHPKLPRLELTATEGDTWTTGSTGSDAGAAGPLAVSGDRTALLGWLSGRGDTTGLTVGLGDAALPALPPL